MFNKIRHQIYVMTYVKYDNNVYPNLARDLVCYLLSNPNKINYYLTKNIHVGQVLDYLSKRFEEDQNIDVLEEVINYVEVLCKNT